MAEIRHLENGEMAVGLSERKIIRFRWNLVRKMQIWNSVTVMWSN